MHTININKLTITPIVTETFVSLVNDFQLTSKGLMSFKKKDAVIIEGRKISIQHSQRIKNWDIKDSYIFIIKYDSRSFFLHTHKKIQRIGRNIWSPLFRIKSRKRFLTRKSPHLHAVYPHLVHVGRCLHA